MYIIAPTDLNWFEYLKENHTTGDVNFWTPTPWRIRNIVPGTKWYFKKKGPGNLICGYGIFQNYYPCTLREAWNTFGKNNGCDSFASFKTKLSSYNNNIDEDITIGSISLSDAVFWDENEYVDLNEIGISFKRNIVKYKSYSSDDVIAAGNGIPSDTSFSLIENKLKRHSQVKSTIREGQSDFRQKISSAYNYKCCITGESSPELLEAAHIQPYISRESNHTQNGMLLRVDFHKMFDSGLMAIDMDYKVVVSPLVASEYYQSYNGKSIVLPSSPGNYPSKEALSLKMQELRK